MTEPRNDRFTWTLAGILIALSLALGTAIIVRALEGLPR